MLLLQPQSRPTLRSTIRTSEQFIVSQGISTTSRPKGVLLCVTAQSSDSRLVLTALLQEPVQSVTSSLKQLRPVQLMVQEKVCLERLVKMLSVPMIVQDVT